MSVNEPEELSVVFTAQQYSAGKLDAAQAAEQLGLVRSRGREARADRLAAFYLGVIAADRRQAGEAEAYYRIALDPAYPDIAAGAALNLGLVLAVQKHRRGEGEELLRQAAASGQEQAATAAQRTLRDMHAGTWPTAADRTAFVSGPASPVIRGGAPLPPDPPPQPTAKAKWWQRGARKEELAARQRAARDALREGWNGVRWGNSLDAFRARFPRATPKEGWWLTGEGPDTFFGLAMQAQYAFNPQDRFFLVAFHPDARDRPRLITAPLEAFGPPPGGDLIWPIGDHVAAEVKGAGIALTLAHRGFTPR